MTVGEAKTVVSAVPIIAIPAVLSFPAAIAIGWRPAQREDIIIKVASLRAAGALRIRKQRKKGARRNNACGQKNEAEKTA
jgi:hypothetical protein